MFKYIFMNVKAFKDKTLYISISNINTNIFQVKQNKFNKLNNGITTLF